MERHEWGESHMRVHLFSGFWNEVGHSEIDSWSVIIQGIVRETSENEGTFLLSCVWREWRNIDINQEAVGCGVEAEGESTGIKRQETALENYQMSDGVEPATVS